MEEHLLRSIVIFNFTHTYSWKRKTHIPFNSPRHMTWHYDRNLMYINVWSLELRKCAYESTNWIVSKTKTKTKKKNRFGVVILNVFTMRLCLRSTKISIQSVFFFFFFFVTKNHLNANWGDERTALRSHFYPFSFFVHRIREHGHWTCVGMHVLIAKRPKDTSWFFFCFHQLFRISIHRNCHQVFKSRSILKCLNFVLFTAINFHSLYFEWKFVCFVCFFLYCFRSSVFVVQLLSFA